MAVDDPKTVDVVSVDRAKSEVILDIADHLDWSDVAEHFMFLQRKINAYAAFIESGELECCYPDAKGRQPVIHVACMCTVPPVAVRFLTVCATHSSPWEYTFPIVSRTSIPRRKHFR